MKTWAKNQILASHALRLAGNFRPPSAAVLMYHSVMPDPGKYSDSVGDIIHSESEFRLQMELIARHYRPVSLDDLIGALQNGRELAKRSVVITFDDGYTDNSENAMPILNCLGVPATFYITVECVERRTLPWPSRLRYAFRNTNQSTWTDTRSKVWMLDNPRDRQEAFLTACDECCQLTGQIQEDFVQRLQQELESCLPSQLADLMMNYDQIRSLAKHGHIVGSHTMTHPNMAYVDDRAAQTELEESKRRLENQLNLQVKHFAYPCPALTPHWNERTTETACALGYASAVTTDSGLVAPGDNPLQLKRLKPTKTADGLRWNLESAFAGRRA